MNHILVVENVAINLFDVELVRENPVTEIYLVLKVFQRSVVVELAKLVEVDIVENVKLVKTVVKKNSNVIVENSSSPVNPIVGNSHFLVV